MHDLSKMRHVESQQKTSPQMSKTGKAPESVMLHDDPVPEPAPMKSIPEKTARTDRIAPDYSQKAVQVNVKPLAGQTITLTNVPAWGPSAVLRLELARVHKIPLYQMGDIVFEGETISDSDPLPRCINPTDVSTVQLGKRDLRKGYQSALEHDMKVLSRSSSFFWAATESLLPELETAVLNACQQVIDGTSKARWCLLHHADVRSARHD